MDPVILGYVISYGATALATWGAAILAKRFGIHVDLTPVTPVVPASPATPADPAAPTPAVPSQPRPVRDFLLWLLSVQAAGVKPAAGELAELAMVRQHLQLQVPLPPPADSATASK